jgi:GDP-4-dehydro-6-deoxy-D-mannose reductase
VGSAAQYGASVVRDQPVEESLPREPRTHYGHAKNVQEGVALQFAHEAKLEVVAARTFNIAGPGDRPWSVIPKTARACLEVAAGRTERVVLGNLESYRDIVDVRDAAQAYVALISGGSSGQAYNVCRGRAVLIREVVHRIAELCGLDASDIESRPASHAVAFDQPWIAGNNNKIKAATPWRPTISLDQTLRDVIADWQGKEAGT